MTFKPLQISKYFLIPDLNGLLIASKESSKGWPKPLVIQDNVSSFSKFCLENFEVSFWNYCRHWKMDELLVAIQKEYLVSLKYCKLFDQSWCDIVTNGDETPLATARSYFLKTLATILSSPNGLRDTSARPENTLLVDDFPHKNIRDNRWNVVYPTAFIASHPKHLLGYLERELMSH